MLDQFMKKAELQSKPIAEMAEPESGKSCIWCRHQTFFGHGYRTGRKGAFICHFTNEPVTKNSPICDNFQGLGKCIEPLECEEEIDLGE